MTNLYKKNEILFAVLLIIVYIMGSSIFDGFSTKLYTLIFQVLLSLVLFGWLYKQRLLEEYGLCKSRISSKKLLYYIPLIVIVSCNLWFGLTLQYTITESVYYVLSMLCVGFLEEMIFRSFLFKAMSKDNLKMAIIVSSVTFGIGHLINLFNGSGAELFASVCQVGYAMAFGYLAVMLFYKSKSLIACILAHGVMNALSIFGNVTVMNTYAVQIGVSLVLFVVSIVYAEYIRKSSEN